jgi:sulfane dehydrogenase subunit SoxC
MKTSADQSTNPGPHLSRRKLLLGGAATAAAVLVKSARGQAVQAAVTEKEQLALADPTKVPGVPPGKLGTRSSFEAPAKTFSDAASRTPLQDLYGTITPSDLH